MFPQQFKGHVGRQGEFAHEARSRDECCFVAPRALNSYRRRRQEVPRRLDRGFTVNRHVRAASRSRVRGQQLGLKAERNVRRLFVRDDLIPALGLLALYVLGPRSWRDDVPVVRPDVHSRRQRRVAAVRADEIAVIAARRRAHHERIVIAAQRLVLGQAVLAKLDVNINDNHVAAQHANVVVFDAAHDRASPHGPDDVRISRGHRRPIIVHRTLARDLKREHREPTSRPRQCVIKFIHVRTSELGDTCGGSSPSGYVPFQACRSYAQCTIRVSVACNG